MGFLSRLFKTQTFTPLADTPKNELTATLEDIIAAEFSEYELRKDIPVTELDIFAKGRAYSYGMYLNGSPKAFIMIMKDRNDYRSLPVVLAKQEAEKNGIPYMNFMPHLPNEPEYIINRLRQNVLR